MRARAHPVRGKGRSHLDQPTRETSQRRLRGRASGPRSREEDRRGTETLIDTGLEYRPGDPVSVRLVRRPPRVSVTDDGAALAKAGAPGGWRGAATRLERELDVNISRRGVVWLPVVAAGPGEEAIVRRIAAASQRFHDELLELDTENTGAERRLHSNDDDRRSRRPDRNALPRA